MEQGTQERAYWHHGYLSALLDVVRLFTGEAANQSYPTGEASKSRYAA